MAFVTLLFGLFFVTMGAVSLFEPKFKLFRDLGFAESEKPGKIERLAARTVGLLVIAWGLFFVYLGM